MPFETRRVMFNYEELQEAISIYGQKYNMSFPDGKLAKVTDSSPKEYAFNPMQKFRITEGEKATPLIFSFFIPSTNEHKYINLTRDFVVESMVDYCINHKIMLPKNHHKAVEVIEFLVALDLTDRSQEIVTKPAASLSFDE